MKEPHKVVFRPLLTEKSATSKEEQNKVTFEVDPGANKIEIRRAVETAFKVRVLDVRTINMQGKRKRTGRFIGRRSNWKKAVVTIAPGDHIDFFEGA